MSITDELRTGGIYRPASNRRYFTENELTAIADRIDAAHEAACAEAYGNGVMSVPIALDESQWVKLPKDADGEIIHVGDMMERGKARGHVIALMFSKYPKKWGGGLHWGVQLEGEQAPTALDLAFHHYHEPTVEDVLRELMQEVSGPCYAEDLVLAKYAAKLRLSEEGE